MPTASKYFGTGAQHIGRILRLRREIKGQGIDPLQRGCKLGAEGLAKCLVFGAFGQRESRRPKSKEARA